MLKNAVPWWTKLGAKIVLSRVPAGYRTWERIGLFVHGAMDEPEYAWRVVAEHLARTGWKDLTNRTIVELGPGDSLATAVIGATLGAEHIWLVDAAPFARTDLEPYHRLARFLRSRGLTPPPVEQFPSFPEMLHACGARYETSGLQGLQRIPPGSVDLVFSQAVLEHVRLHEFASVLLAMRRILAPHGIASHQIDLKDHLAASLNHLRFSERVWESEFMARSGFYTNRLRRPEIVKMFGAAGFLVEIQGVRQWPALPLARRKFDSCFQNLSDEELRVSQFDIIARPT